MTVSRGIMKRHLTALLALVVAFCACDGRKSSLPAATWEHPLRVLFIGDSVTDGNWGGGGAKPSAERNQRDQNHIFGHGYMFLCAAHYMAYSPGCYEFVNRGISGHTLPDLEKRWKADCLLLEPDVVTILIGINDVDHYIRAGHNSAADFDFKEWEATYRRLIDKTLERHDRRAVILCTPFAVRNGGLRELMVDRLGGIVRDIAADYGFPCLDYQRMFDKCLNKRGANEKWYIWDGIHPTAGGHRLMADRWIEAFDQLTGNTE